MNEHSLPEDLARWPKDAYALLGVDHEVNPRDLRRVYTRLIRTFKPEQFPDHFRRIREAYEFVLRQAEFFQMIRGSVPEENAKAEPAAEPIPAPREATDGPTSDEPALVIPPWQTGPSLVGKLEQLWQRACSGEEAAAYRRLVELQEAQPGAVDVLLRLYWLLALTPDLDPKRTPCDWLAQGLSGSLGGPLWELYRREIAENPAEAFSDRCNRLLRQSTQGGRIAELAEWRFQAASRLGRWQAIDDDLEILHDCLAIDEPEAWVRLLISAAELLAAMPGDGARALLLECQRQIEHYGQLQTRLAESLDRLEFTMEVGSALRKRPPDVVPPLLADLIAVSWCRPFVEFRPQLLRYLEHVADDPTAGLIELDDVQSLATPVLAQLSNVLVVYRGSLIDEPDGPRDRETIGRQVGDYLEELSVGEPYDNIRNGLLKFCLREAISPETVAELAADTDLETHVTKDWPLRCVYWACRAFWG